MASTAPTTHWPLNRCRTSHSTFRIGSVNGDCVSAFEHKTYGTSTTRAARIYPGYRGMKLGGSAPGTVPEGPIGKTSRATEGSEC